MQAVGLKSLLYRGRSGAAENSASSAKAVPAARYRPDIDGLRAVAVLPVVFFHAGFRVVQGGFVGVDIFFVISGFLITGILAREIAQGRYSIIEFYRRRARRIFPALTAVTLATLGAAYFILTPDEYVELAKSAAAVSIFSSNIYFWKSVSYFQLGNDFRPLLHTWSLAVEEQYYLFFPLLLRLLHLRTRGIVTALWVICLASLALAALMVPFKPSAAFYLLPTRAWELMLGGLLAVGETPKVPSRRIATMASAMGLILIALPTFAYTAQTPFPGLAALPPTLGTALIIWAGGRGLVSETLSSRPIVAIGKASYSIYLWHLPLLAFAGYLVAGPLTTEAALVLCLASIGLGFVSLVVIEQPFRSTRAAPRQRIASAAIAACGMAVVAAASGSIIVAHGLPSRMSAADAAIVAASNDKYRHHAECMTLDEKIVRPDHPCQLGAPGVRPTVLLWGDSHSMVTATALEQAAFRRRASFEFAADADCPPGLGFGIDQRIDPGLTRQLSYRYCAQYNDEMLHLALRSPTIRTVVISARWTNWRIGEPANPAEGDADVRLRDRDGTADSVRANRPKWERGFFLLVDRLTSAGKDVVIVGPLPEPPFNVPHHLYVERFGFAGHQGSIPLAAYERRHRTILSIFARLSGRPAVSFIWPEQILCTNGQCPIIDHGKPIYFDQDHLSVYGARKTSPLYDLVFDR